MIQDTDADLGEGLQTDIDNEMGTHELDKVYSMVVLYVVRVWPTGYYSLWPPTLNRLQADVPRSTEQLLL